MRGRGALSPPTVRCGSSSAGTPPSFSKQAARRPMQVFLFNMASPPHTHTHTLCKELPTHTHTHTYAHTHTHRHMHAPAPAPAHTHTHTHTHTHGLCVCSLRCFDTYRHLYGFAGLLQGRRSLTSVAARVQMPADQGSRIREAAIPPRFLAGMHGDGRWGEVGHMCMQCVSCCNVVGFEGLGVAVFLRHRYI